MCLLNFDIVIDLSQILHIDEAADSIIVEHIQNPDSYRLLGLLLGRVGVRV